jgi:hypothetical protein
VLDITVSPTRTAVDCNESHCRPKRQRILVPLENLEMSEDVRGYSCFIILTSDAFFSHDTLRHSVLDRSFARCPRAGRRLGGLVCFAEFFAVLLRLRFHADLRILNSTWLGPVGDNTHSPHRGRAFVLFRTTPPPSSQSPNTGAMLNVGQKRSTDNAALTAESGCALILMACAGPHCRGVISNRVSDSYNHSAGVARC